MSTDVKENYRDTQQAAFYSRFRQVYPPTVHGKILNFLSATSALQLENEKNGTGMKKVGNGHVPEIIEADLNGNKVEKKYKLALDVGCGPGQGTLPLCQHFESVIGLDTSAAQIEQARLKFQGQKHVTFRVGDAEDLSFLEDNSVDLITVATAIHWFDVEKFCKECYRVLRPGGVLAAFCYTFGKHRTNTGQDITKMSDKFWYLINNYKDPHIDHVLDRYVKLYPILQRIFPHSKRDDSITEQVNYSVEGMQGFMKSMSMYRNYRVACPDKPDPADSLRDILMEVYHNNPPQDAVHYTFEVFTIMGRK